jgi:dGTPase
MLSSLLSTNKAAQRTLGALRIIAEEFVYTSREVVEPELGGLAALKALLNAFKPMLLLDTQAFEMLGDPERSDRFRAQPINVLLRSLLPPRQMLAYLWQTKKEPKLEPVHRTQLVVDYISGMTDEYALRIVDMIGGTVRAGAT